MTHNHLPFPMTGSVHAALGAAVGRYVKNKPLAFGAGVLSHFLGDITPHHDVGRSADARAVAEPVHHPGAAVRRGRAHLVAEALA